MSNDTIANKTDMSLFVLLSPIDAHTAYDLSQLSQYSILTVRKSLRRMINKGLVTVHTDAKPYLYQLSQ